MKYFEWRGEKVSQFVLGAAQLGMNYGISNKTGQPDKTEAFSILDEAIKNGVTMIDTAQAYGKSESIIGEWIKVNNNKGTFNIISKWNSDIDINDKAQLRAAVSASVETLGVPLWGMMIHDEMHLNQLDAISQASKDLKKEGVLKYLGASVYSVEAAKKAIMNPDIDFIQVPCNAWDHRMIESGVFDDGQEHDTLCFIRSIFLQGLLLMDKEQVKNKLPTAYNAAKKWDEIVIKKQTVKRVLAMSFAAELECPLVVGVQNKSQLTDNNNLLKNMIIDININDLKEYRQGPISENVIMPFKWHM